MLINNYWRPTNLWTLKTFMNAPSIRQRRLSSRFELVNHLMKFPLLSVRKIRQNQWRVSDKSIPRTDYRHMLLDKHCVWMLKRTLSVKSWCHKSISFCVFIQIWVNEVSWFALFPFYRLWLNNNKIFILFLK